MEVETKPHKKRRFLQVLVALTMLASPLILDVATAEPADAGYECDNGWQLRSNNRCARTVRKASYGCDAGWNVSRFNQCYQRQQYCPAGGYLSHGRCNIYFWGTWGSYAPSSRWVYRPMTTSYRDVTEWRAARWVPTTYTPPANTTTYTPTHTTTGTIIDGLPPAGAMIYRDGCQPRIVNSLEIRRFYNDHSHISDGGSTGWFRDLAVIDRTNWVAGCATNGGRMYRYHIEQRKTARVACTMFASGHFPSCDAANWTYDANQWGQGPGHNNIP